DGRRQPERRRDLARAPARRDRRPDHGDAPERARAARGSVRDRDDVHRLRPGDRRGDRAALSARGEPPEEVVRRGYDAIADRYAEWAASFESPAMRWVDALLERLPEGSEVLELGCGGGDPATRALAARHRVLGVDISEQQLERARRLVPQA